MINNIIRNGSSTDKVAIVIEGADGVGITGLTSSTPGLNAYLSKNGGDWATFSLTGVFVEPALVGGAPANSGLYYISLSATNTNTNGVCVLCLTYQGTPFFASYLVWSDFQADITAIKAKTDLITGAPALETTAQAIKAKTDLIPASPALEASVQAVKTKTDALPASPANEVTLLAVKAKTDTLPASPANEVSVQSVLTQLVAVRDRTDNLPNAPANEVTLVNGVNAILAAIDDIEIDIPPGLALEASVQEAIAALAAAEGRDDLILALVHHNVHIDNQDYDDDGNLLSARLRSYDTGANATAGGATGLKKTYNITAEYPDGALQKYVVREIP